jgi:deazaflavin-dependent oxidoreductase (nitroreductase family)
MAARRLPLTSDDPAIGDQLAEWGKVALIETTGRITGKPARAAVGFVEAEGGALVVAAGSESADWALNLRVDPRCTVTIGDSSATYLATEAGDDERASAVTRLILKYGTPAERLGRGPVFRLTRTNQS